MLKPININGTNLPDCWHQTLYEAIKVGRDFKIDRGSYTGQVRKEFDFITIHSHCPGTGELLPKLNPALKLDDPCAQDFLDQYLPYLMTGEEKVGESYTYGQRICKGFMTDGEWMKCKKINDILISEIDVLHELGIIKYHTHGWIVNQMELMIWTYKNKGYRNNQMILQVGQPSDMLLQDPPCLRHIDTRIQDGKLHFFPYFRSWDLWGGFPANLAAIEMMKQYAASEIGVENGEIIASSKGLHLYSYIFEIAETVRGRTAADFKLEMAANIPTDSTYGDGMKPYMSKG